MSKTFHRFVLAVTLPACTPALASEAAAPGSEAKIEENTNMIPAASTTPPIEVRNATLVRRLFEECVNRDQPSLTSEFIAKEYVGPRGERGPDGFATVIAGLRRGFPDIHFTLHDVISDGDKVAVRWTWRGTHQGPYADHPPTGKKLENTAIAVFGIRDGKIAEAWIQTDRLGFWQAMGLVDPSLGQGPGAPVARPPLEQ